MGYLCHRDAPWIMSSVSIQISKGPSPAFLVLVILNKLGLYNHNLLFNRKTLGTYTFRFR